LSLYGRSEHKKHETYIDEIIISLLLINNKIPFLS
jgi:hypothetical protein